MLNSMISVELNGVSLDEALGMICLAMPSVTVEDGQIFTDTIEMGEDDELFILRTPAEEGKTLQEVECGVIEQTLEAIEAQKREWAREVTSANGDRKLVEAACGELLLIAEAVVEHLTELWEALAEGNEEVAMAPCSFDIEKVSKGRCMEMMAVLDVLVPPKDEEASGDSWQDGGVERDAQHYVEMEQEADEHNLVLA